MTELNQKTIDILSTEDEVVNLAREQWFRQDQDSVSPELFIQNFIEGSLVNPDYARRAYKLDRDFKLQEIVYNNIQVRPQDVQNIKLAIEFGEDTAWVMADNTIQSVTIQDLQNALSEGLEQARIIWNEYISRV